MLNLYLISLITLFIGAIISVVLQKNTKFTYVSSLFSISGSFFALIFSIYILVTQSVMSVIIHTTLPMFNISIHIDALAAFFILIISTVALPASLYGIGYMKNYEKEYNLGAFGFIYNLFLISLLLVVTAYNGIYFLFAWEIMSLTSLFLVLFENKKKDIIKSGLVYFIMTHAATAFIMLSFLLLYSVTGSFDFGIIKSQSINIPMLTRSIVYICMIIGFGTKAGIVPFHIWLPRAHGAAPSHVSALMSGVMIKMGILMFFRMFLDILPHAPLWLGVVIILIGAVSSVLGVLYALSEHDIKRLLAYHSIENIGIILLGLGSGLIFISLNQPALAMLAIAAGLFHTLNHAIFKSLLFLGAGSVISQTHTRNIEEYGGLIKLMPYTALFFLVGAVAISGLPPFNGFVSEWLTFQSLFAGIISQNATIKGVFILSAGSLAITGGLAAACFVKAFGITFLARPRSTESKEAKESPLSLVVSMGFLAVLCLVLGIFSPTVINVLQQVVKSFNVFGGATSGIAASSSSLNVSKGFAILNMPILALSIIVALVLAYGLVLAVSRKQKTVRQTLWDCGYSKLTPRMEITATAFSRSLIIIFRGIFQPTKQHEIDYVDADIRYFSKSKTVTLGIINVYEDYIYLPLHKILDLFSRNIKKIQSGNINQYLLYIFILLIGLLIYARYSF